MKKFSLLSASLLSFALLTGCGNSDTNATSNTDKTTEKIANTEVSDGIKELTDDEAYDIVNALLPQVRGWDGVFSEELITFEYTGYVFDNVQMAKYKHLDSAKTEWLAITNQCIRIQEKIANALDGTTWGDVPILIIIRDAYGEDMFGALRDGWADNIYDITGVGERSSIE